MNPNARISALETKLSALTTIIEKQNDTITALTLRVDEHENRMLQANIAPLHPPSHPEYVAQFTQWPKGVGG